MEEGWKQSIKQRRITKKVKGTTKKDREWKIIVKEKLFYAKLSKKNSF